MSEPVRWDQPRSAAKSRRSLPSRLVGRVGLSLLMNALHFIGRSLAVLPRLVDHSRRQQLLWVELADRESIEPSLLTACQAMKLRAPNVPDLDIYAVGAALAEEQARHGRRV